MDSIDLRSASHERAVEVIRAAGNPVRFLVQSLVQWVSAEFVIVIVDLALAFFRHSLFFTSSSFSLSLLSFLFLLRPSAVRPEHGGVGDFEIGRHGHEIKITSPIPVDGDRKLKDDDDEQQQQHDDDDSN